MIDTKDLIEWRRPAGCESSGCPEAAFGAKYVLVRSSDQPEVFITFSRADWEQLRTGDFGEVTR